jgi:hypothetical protein
MKLSSSQRRAVLNQIEDVFQRMKARLLGRFFKGPHIYFEVVKDSNPLHSLEGIYKYSQHVLYGPGAEVNENEVSNLAEISGNYMEAKRLQVQNKIMASIEQAPTAAIAVKSITEHLADTSDYMEKLVGNETRTVQAYADRAGITQVAASLGVDDPTCAKVGFWDKKTCQNCKELWHDPTNPAKPRPWKLSELKGGYMDDHKNPFPVIGPTHPSCRCVLIFIPPNFNFDDGGHLYFAGLGYNYLEEYRKTKP